MITRLWLVSATIQVHTLVSEQIKAQKYVCQTNMLALITILGN